MWANHDWINIHPMGRNFGKELLYPGEISPKMFRYITDLITDRYFAHPSYLKIEGCPYFSVYDLAKFVAIHGSVEATRKAIDAFRERVRSAGFPDLHLNAVAWGKPVLPGEKVIRDLPQLIAALGATPYESTVKSQNLDLGKALTIEFVASLPGELKSSTAIPENGKLSWRVATDGTPVDLATSTENVDVVGTLGGIASKIGLVLLIAWLGLMAVLGALLYKRQYDRQRKRTSRSRN
jgi:hypothetical protein